ncbi:MAG: hypothetical protein A2X78_00905 [Gammaproteobacteria bacterium GWE2_37_16]|nr:MAG: hypothetical protein A2X78_00905 [Gammaproteobacteria bacterium GWE2_37_16]
MTAEDIQTISIKICGRDFKIKCAKDELSNLEKAVQYVDQKIQALHSKDNVISLDRSATITALNIAHELMTLKKNLAVLEQVPTRIQTWQEKISLALTKKPSIS